MQHGFRHPTEQSDDSCTLQGLLPELHLEYIKYPPLKHDKARKLRFVSEPISILAFAVIQKNGSSQSEIFQSQIV